MPLDWIRTIEGLANLNNWIFEHRLQYVLIHLSDVARSWFWTKDFRDWGPTSSLNSVKLSSARTNKPINDAKRINELNGLTNILPTIVLMKFESARPSRPFFYRYAQPCSRRAVLSRAFGLRTRTPARVFRSDLLADLRDWKCMRALRKKRLETIEGDDLGVASFQNASPRRPRRQASRSRHPRRHFETVTNPPRTSKSTICCVITVVILDTFPRTVSNPGYRSNVQVVIRISIHEVVDARLTPLPLAQPTMNRSEPTRSRSKNNPFVKSVRVNERSVVGPTDFDCSGVF